MKIIKVLMDQKENNKEFYSRIQRREFSSLEFIDLYMLALAYLDAYDSLIEEKIFIWEKLITVPMEQKKAYLKKMSEFKNEQSGIIIEALGKIDKEKTKNPFSFGSLYKPYTFGCLDYEYESQK